MSFHDEYPPASLIWMSVKAGQSRGDVGVPFEHCRRALPPTSGREGWLNLGSGGVDMARTLPFIQVDADQTMAAASGFG
jgi:hypothetical protein